MGEGAGAAVIWVAQGTILTFNSDKDTMSRNSGIFWALLQVSGFVGNIFVFTQFQEKEQIDEATRNMVGGVLLAVAGVGTLLMLLIRPMPWAAEDTSVTDSPTQALRR